MSVPASEIGYTSAITGRGDHEAHKGHAVALAKKTLIPPLHIYFDLLLFFTLSKDFLDFVHLIIFKERRKCFRNRISSCPQVKG
jgi:hypothetical protein